MIWKIKNKQNLKKGKKSDDLESLMDNISKNNPNPRMTSQFDSLLEDLSQPKVKNNPQKTPGTVGRVTATTNELDALVQDLVDSSKKVRGSNNPDPLNDIMNDLASTARNHNVGVHASVRSSNVKTPTQPLIETMSRQNTDLDNVLDGLNKVSTSGHSSIVLESVPPGYCSGCRKPVSGDVIQALGKQYHPEHFLCTSCGALLGNGNFYEQESQPQCEKCFYSHFCMQCVGCGLPITTQVLAALNSNWHPSCFVCTNCLGPFPDGVFFERDGRPFCNTCFSAVFAPRCKSCGQNITGNCVNAMGAQWHPEHFVCQYCKRAFAGGLFFEIAGLPYCEPHYQLQQQKISRGIVN